MKKTISTIEKRKIISILLIITLTTFSIISSPARAAMVNTGAVYKQNWHDLSRERIIMFIDRSEVQNQLEAWGVDSDEAKARVDCLTDQEIERISARIDQLPAGGVLGAIVGAALIIFIVLLITDILGFTDVFTFVKK
ncbi:MAG: PA2779 family protein [Desulfobacterales bacterium]